MPIWAPWLTRQRASRIVHTVYPYRKMFTLFTYSINSGNNKPHHRTNIHHPHQPRAGDTTFTTTHSR